MLDTLNIDTNISREQFPFDTIKTVLASNKIALLENYDAK